MINTNGTSSRTSSTHASSSLRPRVPRLISGLDEGDEVAFDPNTAPERRIPSSIPSPIESRSASPIPSKHPSRATSSQQGSRSNSRGTRTAGGTLRGTPQGSSVSLAGLWGNSWTTLQGIASDLLGGDVSPGAQHEPTRRRRNSKPQPRRPAQSAPPKAWGPQAAPPAPATSYIGTGSREQREALVRAQKRKDLLSGGAIEYADSLGRFKRRTSEDRSSVSAPPGENEDRDALVYVHHVSPVDTLAGITIKFNCQGTTVLKANRMWANDSVQSRKILLLPVDACGVKGRPMTAAQEIDLLGDSIDDTVVEIPPRIEVSPPDGVDIAGRNRNESISTTSDRPSSSVISSTTESDTLWVHDSWVLFPSSNKPVEIARTSRRSLGYFPPARRKSQSYSDLDTPSTSLDIMRSTISEQSGDSMAQSDRPQRPRRSRRLSNATNGYFPSYLAGPGGVGTMNKNVKTPGPAQDGLNKLLAQHLPNVAPPANQQGLYLPDLPLYSDNPSALSTPTASGTQSPSVNLEHLGAAMEGWVRKMARSASNAMEHSGHERQSAARASVGVSGRGQGGVGDLIEMVDGFEIGVDDVEEQERGRQGSSDASGARSGLIGGGSGVNFGSDRLRSRGKSGKDD